MSFWLPMSINPWLKTTFFMSFHLSVLMPWGKDLPPSGPVLWLFRVVPKEGFQSTMYSSLTPSLPLATAYDVLGKAFSIWLWDVMRHPAEILTFYLRFGEFWLFTYVLENSDFSPILWRILTLHVYSAEFSLFNHVYSGEISLSILWRIRLYMYNSILQRFWLFTHTLENLTFHVYSGEFWLFMCTLEKSDFLCILWRILNFHLYSGEIWLFTYTLENSNSSRILWKRQVEEN